MIVDGRIAVVARNTKRGAPLSRKSY